MSDILTPEEFSLRLLVAHEPHNMMLLNTHDRALRAERDRYREAIKDVHNRLMGWSIEKFKAGDHLESGVLEELARILYDAALAGPDTGTVDYETTGAASGERYHIKGYEAGPDTGEGS